MISNLLMTSFASSFGHLLKPNRNCKSQRYILLYDPSKTFTPKTQRITCLNLCDGGKTLGDPGRFGRLETHYDNDLNLSSLPTFVDGSKEQHWELACFLHVGANK